MELLLKPGLRPGGQVKSSYKLRGGPFNGQTAYLTTRSTLIFRLGKWHGHYEMGEWVDYEPAK